MKKKAINKLAENFFIEGASKNDDDKHYVLNEKLLIEENNNQERCKILIAVIKRWALKTSLFCSESDKKNEMEEWFFQYKTPSTCGDCVRAQKVLSKIFGNESSFNSLPFVKFSSDRSYGFHFKTLLMYTSKGKDEVVKYMQEQKEAKKKRKR